MKSFKCFIIILFSAFLTLGSASVFAWVKGIYITQSTLEDTPQIKRLIRQSKASGINTFVIDIKRPSRRYQRNIKLVKANNIHYVARVVIFPHGARDWQVNSQQYLAKKNRLIKYATALGANEIQLDYIRYRVGKRRSSQNAHNIHRVIKYYKKSLKGSGIPLQIDVFGETSFKPSRGIGQDLRVFANSVDAVCPMVYPSHYKPIRWHSSRPYHTVHKSLRALNRQFRNQPPFKVYAFIEVSNYRYRMAGKRKMDYIYAQIKAVQDSRVHGWYAWSPNNKYYHLFRMLQSYPVR